MPRIAWFTPNDPEGQTISGAFSLALLPELRKYFEITLFSDDFNSDKTESAVHFLQAAKLHRKNPFDLFIYQLENNPALNFSRIHCGLIPGINIFHHYNFINFGPEPILNSPWQKVVQKFLANTADWPIRGDKFFQQGPQGLRESAWSLQALFTNPINVSDFLNNARLSISNKYNLAPLAIPFPAECSIKSEPQEKFTIIYSGRALLQDRAHKVLKALKEFSDLQLIWMISEEEQSAAKELLNEFSLKADLAIGRNPQNWARQVAKADLAIHSQFTVFDQLSPYCQISMLAGLPIVMNDFGFADSLPEDLVFKISTGQTESAELSDLIRKLKVSDLSDLSMRIKDFAQRNYLPASIAADLAELINKNLSVYAKFYQDWNAFTALAKSDLLNESNSDFEKNLNIFNKQIDSQSILANERGSLFI